MFEHIDMMSMGTQYQPNRVIPTLLGSNFGVHGQLWNQNDVIALSWLKQTATLKCFPHHKVFEHIDMMSIGIQWQH